MNKKLISLLIIGTIILGLAACAASVNSDPEVITTTEVTEEVTSSIPTTSSTEPTTSSTSSTTSSTAAPAANTTTPPPKKSNTVWKEVPIEEGKFISKVEPLAFDLRQTIKEIDYVFSGTIIDRKEFEVSWIDENNEQWGPYRKSILEVKIGKEYYGTSPVKDDTITIYYPYSLSEVIEEYFSLKDSAEYVFLARFFDEEYYARKPSFDKLDSQNYADVYISESLSGVMPIENGTVLLYHDYFVWDNDTMSKRRKKGSVRSNRISAETLLDNGWFIALDLRDFENAFSKLLGRADKLPTFKELNQLKGIE